MIWKALVAVTIGALLGALAKLPYDQLMGFSEPACMVLRSWISIAVLTSLSARRLVESLVDAGNAVKARPEPASTPLRCPDTPRHRFARGGDVLCKDSTNAPYMPRGAPATQSSDRAACPTRQASYASGGVTI